MVSRAYNRTDRKGRREETRVTECICTCMMGVCLQSIEEDCGRSGDENKISFTLLLVEEWRI